MLDVEKIKKGLDICALRSAGDCTSCPYFENTYCNDLLASDAAEYIESLDERIAIMHESMEALEKRNEPMKPTLNENHSYVSDAFKCGKCGHIIRFHAKYCEECGQAVACDD